MKNGTGIDFNTKIEVVCLVMIQSTLTMTLAYLVLLRKPWNVSLLSKSKRKTHPQLYLDIEAVNKATITACQYVDWLLSTINLNAPHKDTRITPDIYCTSTSKTIIKTFLKQIVILTVLIFLALFRAMFVAVLAIA